MVNGNGYEVSEEWHYTDALENRLSVSVQQADEALGAIHYALSLNPLAFDVVYQEDIRVAHLQERTLDGLPAFRIFFRVNESSRRVYLLFVDHG
ncbi:hypothetical protein [Sulfitobacter sp. S190]|uniref:hypothetical protein n=1 Tax=Sulfitobacter sp. S190 TaxID=2867022 RepID=UPI0021A5A4B5|nr:hypothetical protein [Sulfitobacter sp. S190]UWR23454.1 hypothetical protein K3756_05575 [Sulfitobacter sp. S190]